MTDPVDALVEAARLAMKTIADESRHHSGCSVHGMAACDCGAELLYDAEQLLERRLAAYDAATGVRKAELELLETYLTHAENPNWLGNTWVLHPAREKLLAARAALAGEAKP
jgi:hypothetical protein